MTELATVQVRQAPVLHQNRAEDMLVSCTLRRRGRACFWLVPRNLLRAPTATDIHAAGPILSRGPVARRDWIVRCIVSAAKPGHSSLLQRGRWAPFSHLILQMDFVSEVWWCPFSHLILQMDFVSEVWWRPVFQDCSQESWRAATRRSRGREVKAMDSKSIGVSPRRFEPCRLRAGFALLL